MDIQMINAKSTSEKAWYLVYTKANQERLAHEQLSRQGYITYLPLISDFKRIKTHRHSVIVPLFPRYIFIHLDTTNDNWSPIRSTIGVSNIVKFGHKPARVFDGLVEKMQLRETSEGIHEIRQKFDFGDKVRILDGPMYSMEGIFMESRSQERVILLMQLLGKEMQVTTNMSLI